MSDTLDTLTMYRVFDDIKEVYQNIRFILVIVGALYTTKKLLQLSCSLFGAARTYVVPRLWHDKNFPKRFGGKWAVVTGASEGIGRVYAFKLAERKMNVFLISRSESKLKKTTEDIMKLHNVEARYHCLDFTELRDEEQFCMLQNKLNGLDVGILVNNVGQMYDKLQYFLTVPRGVLKGIIDLNIQATVLMTHMVLPQMVSRRKGAIVNLSSAGSIHPTPLMSTYQSAKRFVTEFTSALEYEYASEGITMQAILPSYVSTNMTKNPVPSYFVPDPEVFVESAIRTLGISRANYGYWTHGLTGAFLEQCPRSVYLFGALYLNPIYWSWFIGFDSKENKKVK